MCLRVAYLEKINLLQSCIGSHKCEEAFTLLLPKGQWLAVPFVKSNSVPSVAELRVKGFQMPVLLKRHHLQQEQQLLGSVHTPSLCPHRDPHPIPIATPSSSGEEQLTTPCSPREASVPQLSPAPCWILPPLLTAARAQGQPTGVRDEAAVPRRGQAAPAAPADRTAGMAEALAPHPGKSKHRCSARGDPPTKLQNALCTTVCLLLSLKEKKKSERPVQFSPLWWRRIFE